MPASRTERPADDRGDVREECPTCGRETPHEVAITIETESETAFSREPYRVAECLDCGTVTETRMNDA